MLSARCYIYSGESLDEFFSGGLATENRGDISEAVSYLASLQIERSVAVKSLEYADSFSAPDSTDAIEAYASVSVTTVLPAPPYVLFMTSPRSIDAAVALLYTYYGLVYFESYSTPLTSTLYSSVSSGRPVFTT